MSVPIIGNPKIGDDWMIVLPITCSCGQPFLLSGQVNATRGCPKCGKLHRLMRMPQEHPTTGQILWPIGTANPPIGGPDGTNG